MQLNRTQKKLQSNQASLIEHRWARNEIGNANLLIIPVITNVPHLLMQNKLCSLPGQCYFYQSLQLADQQTSIQYLHRIFWVKQIFHWSNFMHRTWNHWAPYGPLFSARCWCGSKSSFDGARKHYTTENITFIISLLLVCSDNIRGHFTVPKTEFTAAGKY